jgi:hypothetical protein
LFSTDRVIIRLFIFGVCLALIILICAYHGISGKKRIIRISDEMLEKGQLTGRFWRIVKCKESEITVSKFSYSVRLACNDTKGCRPGDNVSFIAQKVSRQSTLWVPERFKVHGTSSFKFCISGIALLLVFLMCYRHLSVERGCFDLIFRKRESSCPMD